MMADLTAFERMLADATSQVVGPPRPVDVAAIVRTATSSASPGGGSTTTGRLRATTYASPRSPSQSRFSATKFAVAAVIVALFGGFLLSGVLTTRQGEERLPAAAPTSSASPVTTPDDIATGGPGTFSPAGVLSGPRVGHTATLLQDGRVLVVGGGVDWCCDDLVASVEVWDPETATFVPAGTLAEPRRDHTATLLFDGRVLVVGGYSADADTLASAEVWDPATASFEPAGTMARTRNRHTATLLQDGRVLVVGELDDDNRDAPVEVWDPATASFGPAGTIALGRVGATATLLNDGRVLVVGDGHDDRPDASAEVWDPATGTFGPAGTMGRGRNGPTATLLDDGRVLVVGGFSGGARGNVALPSVEIWDPATASFRLAGNMAAGRNRHTASLLTDGRVLIVGGNSTGDGIGLSSSEVWDPVPGSFDLAAPLAVGRSGHTATPLLDGRVLVVGGRSATDETLASAEVWEPGD